MSKASGTKRTVGSLILLVLILSGCRPSFVFNTIAPTNPGVLSIAESDHIPPFDKVLKGRTFSFPEDHGSHPSFQSEWWYYTGNLTAQNGERLSYQFTIFRRGISPESLTRTSTLAANQIYFAHFAVGHIDQSDHKFSERFSRGAPGLAGASNQPYRVFLENWRIEALDDVGQRIHLTATENEMAINLELEALKPIVVHGEGGISAKSDSEGMASYYLSFTRMKTSGLVQFNGESYTVEGLSWFDHEWSTSALAEGVIGWDWFSLQLENQQDLMLYILRREDGSIEPVSGGTLVSADGTRINLQLGDIEIEVLDTWESSQSGAVYPGEWRILIPDQGIRLEVTPTFQEQEMRVSFVYWEGSVEVLGTVNGHLVGGSGFVELTGYFESLAGVF